MGRIWLFLSAVLSCIPPALAVPSDIRSIPDLEPVKTNTSSVVIENANKENQGVNKLRGVKTDYCATAGANPSLCSNLLRNKTCPPGYTLSKDRNSESGNQVCESAEIQNSQAQKPETKSTANSPQSTENQSQNQKQTQTESKKSVRENQDAQVSAAQESQASACQSAASSAADACSSAIAQIDGLKNQFSAMSTRIQNDSGAKACGQMANESNQIANQMQGLRNSCGQAVSSCQQLCQSAESSLQELQTSAAYLKTTLGQSQCQSSNTRLSNMDMNINQVQMAASQAQRCYNDLTGSSEIPSYNDSTEQRKSSSLQLSESLSGSRPTGMGPTSLSGSSAGVRRTSDLDSQLKMGESSGDPALKLNDPYQESSPSPSASRRNSQSFPSASGLSSGVGSGSAPSESQPGKNQNGQSHSRLEKYLQSGTYSGEGQRMTRNLLTSPVAGAVPISKNRVPGSHQSSGPDKVDLRRFAPNFDRNTPSLKKQNEIGSAHANIFKTVRTRYSRLSDSFVP